MSKEQTVAVFEGLYRIVKNIANPGECSSVERCIFSHLHDLYAADYTLKSLQIGKEFFNTTWGRIRQSFLSQVTITTLNHGPRNANFMLEAIVNFRRGSEFDIRHVSDGDEAVS